MRIGMDLRHLDDPAAAAVQAESLGLWAVLVSGPPGTEAIRAAEIVTATSTLRVFVDTDVSAEHPFTIAEELSVLDNLSAGRIGAVLSGDEPDAADVIRRALMGRPVNGVMLTPPPVQTVLVTWIAENVARRPDDVAPGLHGAAPGWDKIESVSTSTGLDEARSSVDRWRDLGCTHLFLACDDDPRPVARHLTTRAVSADFPEIVSSLADQLLPYDT